MYSRTSARGVLEDGSQKAQPYDFGGRTVSPRINYGRSTCCTTTSRAALLQAFGLSARVRNGEPGVGGADLVCRVLPVPASPTVLISLGMKPLRATQY